MNTFARLAAASLFALIPATACAQSADEDFVPDIPSENIEAISGFSRTTCWADAQRALMAMTLPPTMSPRNFA